MDKKEFPKGMMTLEQTQNGQKVRIALVEAGHALRNRLAAMGLLENEPIEIIRNDHRGQVIISVKGCKVVLGRGMSQKIFVR